MYIFFKLFPLTSYKLNLSNILVLPTTETEKMVILLKQEQQLNEQQQKKKFKDPQEIALKGRRRVSGAQRFPHGGNIWNPLNLRNIKPTQPNGHCHTTKSNEIAQTNVKVPTTEGQQSKGMKRFTYKRKKRKGKKLV
jgi:hypothetical protein